MEIVVFIQKVHRFVYKLFYIVDYIFKTFDFQANHTEILLETNKIEQNSNNRLIFSLYFFDNIYNLIDNVLSILTESRICLFVYVMKGMRIKINLKNKIKLFKYV